MSFLIAFALSFVSTFFLMPILLRFCQQRGLYDIPDARKIHTSGIPRLGGTLFAPCASFGFALSSLFLYWQSQLTEGIVLRLSSVVLIIGMGLIYLMGVFDDIIGIRATVKFGIQITATLFMPLCGLYINNLYGLFGLHEIPLFLGYPLTVFACLLIVNAFNLIDGIDGLSSSLAMIALAGFALLFWQLNVMLYALIALSLIGSVLAFFYYNMWGKVQRCTKTFMGDTGTLVLGYVLAFFAIKLAMNNPHILPDNRADALNTAISLLALPCFDLVRVACSRLLRGQGIFTPDRTHIHHKFLDAGFSNHQSLLCLIACQIFIIALHHGATLCGINTHLTLFFNILLFIGLNLWLTYKVNQRNKTV